jgi:hypothetical protein
MDGFSRFIFRILRGRISRANDRFVVVTFAACSIRSTPSGVEAAVSAAEIYLLKSELCFLEVETSGSTWRKPTDL